MFGGALSSTWAASARRLRHRRRGIKSSKSRRDQDDIVRQRMADALINDPSRSFWTEVKRIRNNNSGTSLVVDGCSDKAKLSQVFLCKYRELYTSVPYDAAEMQDILTEVESQLSCVAAASADHICTPQD